MHTLTERWYAWEEARKVAKTDEEVDLTGIGPAYTPRFISVRLCIPLRRKLANFSQDDEYFEPEPDEAGPESDQFGEEHVRAGKDLPKSDFFNTPQEPQTLKDKMAQKVKRVLWNK